MAVTFLSLGSNLGDRELYLKKAIDGLTGRRVEIVRRASLYETEPRDVADQPWFLNTVVEARTQLSPEDLLKACLDTERDNSRVRTAAKGARTLDIDVLFYDDRIIRQPGLIIPHPRLAERKFVLLPLSEIASAFVDPKSGVTVAKLLDRCPDNTEVKLHQ
jgi:2-amino-4-hydroxy-6-hydroxymethyldihydropteridine diphosphokinase